MGVPRDQGDSHPSRGGVATPHLRDPGSRPSSQGPGPCRGSRWGQRLACGPECLCRWTSGSWGGGGGKGGLWPSAAQPRVALPAPPVPSRHSHNNLRITRILKSLGELGLEHYQAPLARFFLEETLVRRQLPGVRQSALDYFVFAVRCRHQRRELLYFAWEHFRPRCRFVWGPHDKLQKFRPCSPPCSPQPARPRQANREESPGEPLLEAAAQGQTCGPGRDEEGDPVAKGPQPPGTEPQEAGASEKDQGDEAGDEQGPESPNPKERKKRKLEANLRARSPGEPGPSASEVEKIALNLEGCALSQGSLGAETQEVGSQAPEEAEQPRPQPLEAKVADDVRKRRKTDQGARDGTGVAAGDGTVTLAAAQPPAPSRCPAAEEGENGVKEEADGPAGPEQGAPGSPATAGPEVDERAEPTEAGPSVQPGEP